MHEIYWSKVKVPKSGHDCNASETHSFHEIFSRRGVKGRKSIPTPNQKKSKDDFIICLDF